jgi:hypothetical protein
MGQGDQEARLRELVRARGIESAVRWLEPRSYGEPLFSALYDRHLLLACPLGADTPRSAWDAMAAGVPIAAYDTPFYRGMADLTGAVDVVPWLDDAALADKLVTFAQDKSLLSPKVESAVAAARRNTQHDWLQRRADWVFEVMRT